METTPRNVKMGCALGFLGGVISVVCLAVYFRPEEIALVDMGVYMLIAAMFFALAGGMSKAGQWRYDILLLMSFLTIGVVGSSLVFEALDIYIGILLILIGALIVLSLSVPSAKIWADRVRF